MKTAVLTGGSGGLGRAAISCLKKNGWQTISVDLETCNTNNPEERADKEIIMDVSNPESISKAFDAIQQFCMTPDALICLAGIVIDAPVIGIARGMLKPYPVEAWRTTLDINLTGTFLCAREYVERLIRKRHKGVIITCSSPAASGAPGQSAYAASKAGVEAFTISLAREVAPFGIRVCGFRPPLTNTPMADKYPQHIMDNLIRKSLLQRFARAEEVAETLHFLASNELASGRIFKFDGGLTL
jgi:3-oxoacyl-[acyl-carrier protein] reductase